MAAKSDKMYASSPSVKRGEDGKTGIHKPTKASAVDAGLAGNPLPQDTKGEMPVQVKQYSDMQERHIQELKDMHKRHKTEHEKLAADHSGMDDATKSLTSEGTM